MKIPAPLLLLLLVPVITVGCGSSTGKDAISEQQRAAAGAFPDCLICHSPANPPFDPLFTNGQGEYGKHIAHVTDSGFTCVTCHYNYTNQASHMNGIWDTPNSAVGIVYFDSANPYGLWSNDTGNCSNVYCHSIVQKASGVSLLLNTSDYKTPAWGDGEATCASCHGNPPVSGSHLKHAGGGTGQYAYTCEQCHSGYVPPSATVTHADGAINTFMNTTWGGKYNGDTTPGSGFSNCGNTYCHSDGTSVATGVIPDNTSPTWSNTAVPLTCTSCHGVGTTDGRPSYPQMTLTTASPKANEHASHMQYITTAYECDGCHYTTTTTGNTITNPANHANGQYDVVVKPGMTFTGEPGNVNFTYVPDPGGLGGRCDNVTCHGGSPNSAFWGRFAPYITWISITHGPGCFEAQFAVTEMSNVDYPVTYTWTFGDESETEPVTSSTLPSSPSHKYSDGTQRTVTITGRDKLQRYLSRSTTVTPQPVANQKPTAGWQLATINRYTVTVTDLSSDPDYDTCNPGANPTPGWIIINWDYLGSLSTKTQEWIYLTDSPSNKSYSYMYDASTTKKPYTITHSIVDNNNTASGIPAPNLSVTLPGNDGQTDISGKVFKSDGTGFAGVTVYLKPLLQNITVTTTTGEDGSYSFSGVYYDWFLLVWPEKDGYEFLQTIWCPGYFGMFCNGTQCSCVFTNRTDVNFTASP